MARLVGELRRASLIKKQNVKNERVTTHAGLDPPELVQVFKPQNPERSE
jgi:hypothetical protein